MSVSPIFLTGMLGAGLNLLIKLEIPPPILGAKKDKAAPGIPPSKSPKPVLTSGLFDPVFLLPQSLSIQLRSVGVYLIRPFF